MVPYLLIMLARGKHALLNRFCIKKNHEKSQVIYDYLIFEPYGIFIQGNSFTYIEREGHRLSNLENNNFLNAETQNNILKYWCCFQIGNNT